MRGLKIIFVNILLLQVLFTALVSGQSYSDASIKAIFIEKFTSYISWPENSKINDTSEDIKIYVFGESDFYDVLKNIYANRKINGRDVIVKNIFDIDEVDDCHILFIPQCGKLKLQEILKITDKKPILTISDTRDYAETGVLINFTIVENKVHFEINRSSVEKSGLKFDFRLINIATII